MPERPIYEPSWMDWVSDPRLQGVAAPSGANLASQYLIKAGQGLASLPERAMNVGTQVFHGREPDMGTVLEAATLPFGGTAFSATKGALGAGPAIRAYHGSPHSFDKFDIGKLGTGEGGQAYGHGLYFAENPAVAETYKTAGGRRSQWTVNDKTVSTSGVGSYSNVATPELGAAFLMEVSKSDKSAALKAARSIAQYDKSDPAFNQAVIDLLENATIKKNLGHMYEVDIKADPAKLMKYDRPLSENPVPVRELAKEFGLPETVDLPGKVFGKAIDRMFYKPDETISLPMKGETLYKRMSDRLGHPSQASKELDKAGVPGLTFLDRGSRDRGKGTSNIVSFRDDIIDILKRFGIAGLAPLGGLAAMQPGAYKGGEQQ